MRARREEVTEVDSKEADALDFVARRRGAADDLTPDEDLVDVVDMKRVIVAVAIEEGEQLGGTGLVARLLPDLPDDRTGWGIAHVSPTPWQGPHPIGSLLDQEELPVLEHHSTHIHLRRGVPGIAGEHIKHPARVPT